MPEKDIGKSYDVRVRKRMGPVLGAQLAGCEESERFSKAIQKRGTDQASDNQKLGAALLSRHAVNIAKHPGASLAQGGKGPVER